MELILSRQEQVTIVVDSSSCIPRKLQKLLGIIIVPHTVVIESKTYRDGVDINPTAFYRTLQLDNKTVTTTGPNPKDFLAAFNHAYAKSSQVLCITVSRKFSSSTYQSANIAARMAKKLHPSLKISVVDSQGAAGAHGFIALEAARYTMMETRLQQIVSHVESMIPKVQLVAFLDTLHYLVKSGRITKIKAWATTLFRVKPLMELSQGVPHLISKPRSRSKAIHQLLSIVAERTGGKPVHVNVMHADSPYDAKFLMKHLQSNLNCKEAFITEFTPVMGAHTGPGLVGVAFYSND
ncbi:DegV family protein [SAR202 cluster bacterium AC-409-J13_OGT_754m]|nr:DegV family protein [SAR202 cluster bacterium AC-409-J13_OGT_754m]